MTIRTRIILVLSGVLAVFLGADLLATQYITRGELQEFTREELERAGQRVQDAIEAEYADLERLASALAHPLRHANLGATDVNETLQALDLDLINLAQTSTGQVVWQHIFSPEDRTPMRLRQLPAGALAEGHPLLTGLRERRPAPGESQRKAVGGIYLTDAGLTVVSTARFRDARDVGHVLTVGRFLDPALISRLGKRAGCVVQAWSMDDPDMPPSEVEIAADLIPNAPTQLMEREGESNAYLLLEDLVHMPGLLVRLQLANSGLANIRRAMDLGATTTLGVGLAVLLVLLQLLKRLVTRPLELLTVRAEALGRDDGRQELLDIDRTDEIGRLSGELNDMVRRLRKSREALILSARHAGMAQVASDVLHSAGTKINSVGVSLDVAARDVHSFPIEELTSVRLLLEKHEDALVQVLSDSGQGSKILPFMREVEQLFEVRCSNVQEELGQVSDGLQAVIALINEQQQHAGSVQVAEHVVLEEEIEVAIRTCAGAFFDPYGIRVSYDADSVHEVLIDRHKLSQVLVAVLENAGQAIARTDNAGLVTVRLRSEADLVMVEVADDGCGFDSHTTTLFRQGWSSTGRSGQGLHVASLVAKELGGDLAIRSDGLHKGACATLTLRVAGEPEATRATSTGSAAAVDVPSGLAAPQPDQAYAAGDV